MPGQDYQSASESVLLPPESNGTAAQNKTMQPPANLPSPSSASELPQTKDSPLTDIGTSPPPFEIASLRDKRARSRDSYESSELSDLGDEESEAETDKMDFLNDETSAGHAEKESDLQRLSELSGLAQLQELDSEDSDKDFVTNTKSPSMVAAPEVELHRLQADSARPPKRSREVMDSNSGDSSEDIFDRPQDSDQKKRRFNGGNSDDDDLTRATDSRGDDRINVSPPEANGISAKSISESIDNTNKVVEASLATAVEPADALGALDAMKKSMSDADATDELVKSNAEDASVKDEFDEDGGSRDEEDTIKSEQKDDEEVDQDPHSDNEEMPPTAQVAEDLDLDEQRKSAVEELISIEKDFSLLRDKLYRDKLSLLEHELQLCLDGSHPELLQIYYRVNEFYQDNIKLANATLNYSLKCINTETVATRTAIHQNFMKNLLGMKNDMITDTTSLWYKINKEWNYLDSAVAEYNYTAMPSSTPEYLSLPVVAGGSSAEYYSDNFAVNKKIIKQNALYELVQRRNCLNAELGVLNGLQEFHGLPSAVANSLLDDEMIPAEELLLRKATSEEINEDLQAMGIF